MSEMVVGDCPRGSYEEIRDQRKIAQGVHSVFCWSRISSYGPLKQSPTTILVLRVSSRTQMFIGTLAILGDPVWSRNGAY